MVLRIKYETAMINRQTLTVSSLISLLHNCNIYFIFISEINFIFIFIFIFGDWTSKVDLFWFVGIKNIIS